ncbi:MAG: hypothetical protein WC881_12165, partial [Elusimicrobiota bacterium]
MDYGPPPLPLALAAALCAAAAAGLAADRPRPPRPAYEAAVFEQEAVGGDPNTHATQKIAELPDAYSAEYGFENFNSDQLQAGFQVKKSAFQSYAAEWGYSTKDINALKAWLAKARQEAFQTATQNDSSQEQLDAAVAGLQKQYRQKLEGYMASRGFKLLPDDSARVDMPALARKNAPLVKPLMLELDRWAQKKHYGSEEIV